MIARTILVASRGFGAALSAERVAAAIGRGLAAGGLPPPDLCPIVLDQETPADLRELLHALDFDERMRRARSVVVAARRLDERTLLGSATFEIASRARQAGVPAYAVARENALDPFDARMLDLQVILEAASTRALVRAGRRLAELV